MTLPPFEYRAPSKLEDALKILSCENARVLAGGTDLIVNLRRDRPKGIVIVDLKKIQELYFLREKSGKLFIGPLMTLESLIGKEVIGKYFPSLFMALKSMGSLQVRNRGTIGGNICNASPCADTVPPLLIHNAILTLENFRGKRRVKLEDFLKGPYKTDLKEDEILTSIEVEKLNGGESFLKLGRRGAMNKARMNFAAYIKLDGRGYIEDGRIAAGALTPSPMRFRLAEEFLKGKKPEEGILEGAARLVKEEVLKITGVRWSTPYKLPVIENLVKRILSQALLNSK
jgi:carbon-monoxide dehydrogenase medium subunit/xanthine dehydrogenase FAD-binding subunit